MRHADTNQKEAGLAISIPGRRDFRGESSGIKRAPHKDRDQCSKKK